MKTEKKYAYHAFGFTVSTDIELPELDENLNHNESFDISVTITDLSERWSALENSSNDGFVIQDQLIMFHVPRVAIYCIQNGTEIYVQPLDYGQYAQIKLYLLGTCMGAILMQRNILPLHGSAIAINGKVYAIVGHSGAGKSTLASAFLNRGYKLLSDDVIPVSFNDDNIPMVTPSYPQQKLWLESLNQFGMEALSYQPIVERENKFVVPVTEKFLSEPLPLAGIIELVKTNDQEDVEIHPITSLESLRTVYEHTYRNFFIEPLGLLEWHFTFTTKMLQKLSVYQLKRPLTRFTAYELTDKILSTINEEAKIK